MVTENISNSWTLHGRLQTIWEWIPRSSVSPRINVETIRTDFLHLGKACYGADLSLTDSFFRLICENQTGNTSLLEDSQPSRPPRSKNDLLLYVIYGIFQCQTVPA